MVTVGIDIGMHPDPVRHMKLARGRSCPVLPTTSVSGRQR